MTTETKRRRRRKNPAHSEQVNEALIAALESMRRLLDAHGDCDCWACTEVGHMEYAIAMWQSVFDSQLYGYPAGNARLVGGLVAEGVVSAERGACLEAGLNEIAREEEEEEGQQATPDDPVYR